MCWSLLMGGFGLFFLVLVGFICFWMFGFGGRGLREEVFVGAGFCSFYFVLCTSRIYFEVVISRVEGKVTVFYGGILL